MLAWFLVGEATKAIIERTIPTQSRMENQFVIYFRNRIHFGVFGFGDNLLSP